MGPQAFDDMGRKAIIARKALDEYFEARDRFTKMISEPFTDTKLHDRMIGITHIDKDILSKIEYERGKK